PFPELLTAERGTVQKKAGERLADRCSNAAPGGLGIHLEGLAIHDLHPPQEVVQAYHDVTQAMERRDQRINDARSMATRMEREAEAKRLEIVRQAKAAGLELTTLAEAVRDAFLTRRRARVSLNWEEECRLLEEAIARIDVGEDSAHVWQEYE